MVEIGSGAVAGDGEKDGGGAGGAGGADLGGGRADNGAAAEGGGGEGGDGVWGEGDGGGDVVARPAAGDEGGRCGAAAPAQNGSRLGFAGLGLLLAKVIPLANHPSGLRGGDGVA